MPEPIITQDGTEKNDGERKAAQRFSAKLRQDHPHLKFIITEDSLSSNAPHIETLHDHGCHYILGVKEGDQAYLSKQVQAAEEAGRVTSYDRHDRAAGVVHRFRGTAQRVWVPSTPAPGAVPWMRQNAQAPKTEALRPAVLPLLWEPQRQFLSYEPTRTLFSRQHEMIFRWGSEPLIIDKGVQGCRDILDHPCTSRLLHGGDLACYRGRGEKPQRICFDRRKANRQGHDPHVDVAEAGVGHEGPEFLGVR